ncbi:MAG: hypothetical protein COA79_06075 [Planctomycetota bacterium]|nr:MAG: hypothetical protein COA79_06075 [Planctomycetota bacterium]
MEEFELLLMEYAKKAINENDLIEIVSASFLGPQKNLIGNITIWHPDSVDLNMCEQVSNNVNEMLDSDDPFEFQYTLEVSSLSLTRKLKEAEDFRRAMGETIKIKFNDKTIKEAKGRLINFSENTFTIEQSGKEINFTYIEIKQANIIF